MPSTSNRGASRAVKTQKITGHQAAIDGTKKHRFQPFSQRIARLNIDPVRRSQQLRAQHTLQNEASHFSAAFEEWTELNISANFTLIVQEIRPLCESLPQILHHKEKIFAILITYLNKADAICLEPLLSLVAHFAHDLGVRFEVFFGAAVTAISNLAATHHDIEVIEWSFTCLAWLFKYLSQLLVADLRPLYNVLAPFLGKTRQKSFVTRFTAEALSFLVKKAGASRRGSRPLTTIVHHIFDDLVQTPHEQRKDHERGIITLFTESIKGVRGGLHSNGKAIAQALGEHLFTNSESSSGDVESQQFVIESVFVNVANHTDVEGFAPILEGVVNLLSNPSALPNRDRVKYEMHLLFILVAVSAGSRIGNWKSILEIMNSYICLASSTVPVADPVTLSSILCTLAAVLQFCPLEEAVPYSAKIVDRITEPPYQNHFLQFCILVADSGAQRFTSLLSPELCKFISNRWMQYEEILCFLLPRFAQSLSFKQDFHLPRQLQEKVANDFQSLRKAFSTDSEPESTRIILACNQYVDLSNTVLFDSSLLGLMSSELMKVIEDLLTIGSEDLKESHFAFLMGKGFQFTVDHQPWDQLKSSFWELVCGASLKCRLLPRYIAALTRRFQASSSGSTREFPKLDVLVDSLIENLSATSHDIRLLSLEALEALYQFRELDMPIGLTIALNLERTPFTLETARSASLNIKKMASTYEQADPWMERALPLYCFGLLHVRLASVWEDACSALRTMTKLRNTENLIMEKAMRWLMHVVTNNTGVSANAQVNTDESEGFRDFPCSTIMRLEGLAYTISMDISHTGQRLQESYDADNRFLLDDLTAFRSQALRILNRIPEMAERRSRIIMPLFIQVMRDSDCNDTNDIDRKDQALISQCVTLLPSVRWSRKDQKALLEVLTHFANPAALYRSNDVYEALLALLCNGDNEIQGGALKAVFAWKNRVKKPYQQNLLNILEDARFRDEISVFLNVENDETAIQQDDQNEIMPILLRLLYGRVISRKGPASAQQGQVIRRKTVLEALARFGVAVVGDFLAIALGPLNELHLIKSQCLDEPVLQQALTPLRKQIGMLKMLRTMLDTLSNLLSPFKVCLVDAVIYCLIRASRGLRHDLGAQEEGSSDRASIYLQQNIRAEALNCLTDVFKTATEFKWEPYASIILDEVIYSRLNNFPLENAQGVSGLLRLISVWTESAYLTRAFITSNPNIISTVMDCLAVPSARDDVRLFVLNNVGKNIIEFAGDGDCRPEDIVDSCNTMVEHLRGSVGSTLLRNLAQTIQLNISRECLEACISTIVKLKPFVHSSNETRSLIESSLYLLQQPPRNVSPRLKGKLVQLLDHFVPLYDLMVDSTLFSQTLRVVSSLFSYFKDSENRHGVVSLFHRLADQDTELTDTAQLCKLLNSYTSARLDEPDYSARSRAFELINDEKNLGFGSKQWQALLHNMLFFVQDDGEFSAMRSYASLSLRRCLRAASANPEGSNDMTQLLANTLLPALHKGVREPSEHVRTEYVSVLCEAIKCGTQAVSDMQSLLGPDEESSFFNNILHIQQHRRIRALHRLSAEATGISSVNISQFCIPLIEHYISSADNAEHSLAAEAIKTLNSLAEGLDWTIYHSLLKRMIDQASKLDSKLRIRALGAVADSMYRAQMSNVNRVNEQNGVSTSTSRLSRTLPTREKLANTLSKSILPSLLKLVHFKDDSTPDIRLMLATIAVKIILVLRPEDISRYVPPLLMDVSNILRSRDQNARDTARKTLTDISALIGAPYFGFVLKQLRSSLQRGYQLHVLSYTVHSILVSVAQNFKAGDLDYCIPVFMTIIMDDVFGIVGSEKEAQDYINRMKEVKNKTLGYDSMQLLTSITSIQHIAELIKPLQAQLDKPRPMLAKVDEMLRRIREGLRQNDGLKDHRQVLVLCYEILQHAIHGPHKTTDPSSYKMAAFAMDLLRRILDKHDTELKTVENVAGFLPLLTFSMSQQQEEVQASAFRCLTAIIKVPLTDFDASAKDYVNQAKRVVESSASTSSPLAQAALRFISAILRERPHAAIQKAYFETQIAFLLERIKPDLLEPARQGDRDRQIAAFNFLRAVLSRGVLITEVYSIMDTVREVMITSSEHPIPDLARSVYSRFVLDYYPDDGKAFMKQVDFLCSNLQYEHTRGRQSVMEVLLFLITKKHGNTIQPLLESVFPALIRSLVEDKECYASAHLLLRQVFERADKERTNKFKAALQKWLKVDSLQARDFAFRCWKLYFDVHTTLAREAAELLPSIELNLKLGGALTLLMQLCELFPSIAFAGNTQNIWTVISALVPAEEDQEVLLLAQNLIGVYLADFAKNIAKSGQPQALPMLGSAGLQLTSEDAARIAEIGMAVLQTARLPPLIDRIIQNLSFLGRVSAADSDGRGVPNSLLTHGAGVLRSESSPLRSKLASVKLMAMLCKAISAETIQGSLQKILLPLRNLTDSSIALPIYTDPDEIAMQEELVQHTQELLVALQSKLGTTVFVGEMQQVQKEVKDRREERRAKRRIEAVMAPEKVGREKMRKNEKSKIKRREKNNRFAGRRRGW